MPTAQGIKIKGDSVDAVKFKFDRQNLEKYSSTIGEDGLRVGPTIERSNQRKNTYSPDTGTIRAERPNLTKDNPLIMFPVRIAGDVASLFRDDGINFATGEVARLNKPYAGLTLAVEAITTFSPLMELRGLMGAGKLGVVEVNAARLTAKSEMFCYA